ncbi:NHLP-related RiPP peptide [uncultured Aquimonas sp.]|uniref:NHLP-related RiPP peptide n=1 Tax=uncultured Aquimonas sp. TaxID=385483 RepID=UPI00086C0BA7|nr:NHLP-related RiPP peptide [uncultured Aquimonas sp.]ODU42568.1 MAG: hypothetical protein ABS96_27720 [Xanthomonadaceae bacterium SCN 69-123]
MPTQEQARALLERLASDDSFRQQVTQDPAAALADYGFKLDAANLPKQPIQLPSPEAIKANLDSMSGDLAVGMAILFFKA